MIFSLSGVKKEFISGLFRKKINKGVDDVFLSLEKGCVLGLVGPNGAGKSTTIKILLGYLRPDSGVVTLQDLPVSLPKSRLNVGYSPENPKLPSLLTPRELLKLGLGVHQATGNLEREVSKWLDIFDLISVANKPIKEFSKGMTQRASLAHAFAVGKNFLVLDEPLSGLDPLGRKLVVDLLADYKKRGGTILLTSHVLHDVETLADQFALIKNGKIIAKETPANIFDKSKNYEIRIQGSNIFDGGIPDGDGRWRIVIPKTDFWGLMNEVRESRQTVVDVKADLSLEKIITSMII